MKRFSIMTIGALLLAGALRADVHTDLQALSTQGGTLKGELSALSFQQEATCLSLGALNRSLEAYTASIATLSDGMTPFSVTAGDLDAVDTLSALARQMGLEAVRLSGELSTVETVAELFEYRAGLSAMLQLSSDIGTMADRILEMSDRILVMADNIGLMADRILLTQQIQNGNIALTQASILTTQRNMVLLSDSLSTIVYNLTLAQLGDETALLTTVMQSSDLNSSNMAAELAAFELQSAALLTKTTALLATAVENSAKASHYINADTLTLLGDLTTLHSALAQALEAYSNTILRIAPLTETPVLSDAVYAMLQLTKDIGTMSDRIMAMTGDIYTMADNIGLMADRIVATQTLQMTNVELTQASLLTSQSIMIELIANYGL